MAKGSLKKTVKDNEQSLRVALIAIAAVSVHFCDEGDQVFHILIKFFWYGSLVTKWSYATSAMLLGVPLFIYRNFVSFAKTTKDDNGEIVSVRAGLSDPGLIEYHWDVLYIDLLVTLLSPFSNYGWLPYLTVPAYAAYLVISGLVIPFFSRGGDEEEDDGTGKKKRDRSEQRARKSMFVRR